MFRSYRRRLLTCTIAGLVLLAVFGGEAFGAATGKIAGTITDKETKQPVIGASVLVVGTSRGAQTDLDGKYTIFQVEPGTYTLRISHIEYRTVEVTDVAVKADITTEQSIQMEQTATEVEAVRVVGQKDKLEIKEVSNQVTITKEEIRTQPVTTVDELLTQVAGVVTNSQGEVFIRGGRAGEVSYIVDGVPLDDPLGASGAQMSLVSGSIQEFTVIKDGFDPEYG
ncbi:MAG TPA: carboxypeptidase-like regulatory domain-containing protein, partial [candidate division Zixibacteria bacterium]|nr:carboxypeptidase-like regulatory domain-containing protein [candidate division Zixibacteria bacterium]